MSSILEETDALIVALGDSQTASWGLCGMLALLVYDICLFFPAELKAIWRAKWTWGKTLYIVFRYGTVCDILALFINSTNKNPSLPLRVLYTISAMVRIILHGISEAEGLSVRRAAIICFWSMEVIQALRTAAIFAEVKIIKRGIYLYCVLQNIFLLCITIRLSTSVNFFPSTIQGVTCSFIESLSRKDLLALQAVGLAYEVILWILGSIRISQIALNGRSKFAWLLFKDTVIYFPINSVLSLSAFLAFLILPTERGLLFLLFDGLWIGLMSIAITRMVLHLREYVSAPRGSPARGRSDAVRSSGLESDSLPGIISTSFAFKTIEVEMEMDFIDAPSDEGHSDV